LSQSNFAEKSAAFTAPFERASTVTQDRFTNPLYPITEKLLPYGRRFKEDVAYVKSFGERIVRSMSERLREEEEGKTEVETKQGEAGQGSLLRELVKEYGKDDDYGFLADACLNFLTAGE
jgi:hypothetical protein